MTGGWVWCAWCKIQGRRMTGTSSSSSLATGDDQAWHRFLALLAPDRERAATMYAALRRRLIDLFRWRGLAAADDLADEALERAVRHVAAGDEIRSVTSYVCGVAHRLALEAARREAKVAPLDEDVTQDGDGDRDDDDGDRLASLERCLDRMPANTRRMVLRYYAVGDRIADRKRLADELGINLNALRIRMHRLRNSLETCLGEAA